jgi:hypothetical protein
MWSCNVLGHGRTKKFHVKQFGKIGAFRATTAAHCLHRGPGAIAFVGVTPGASACPDSVKAWLVPATETPGFTAGSQGHSLA